MRPHIHVVCSSPRSITKTEAMKLLLPIALWVLVLLLVQWEMSFVSGSDSVLCREEERSALLHINASIHFPIHSLEGKWEGKECCRWERVTCDPTTGHVTQLDLGVFHEDDDFDHERGILLNASMFLPLRQLRSLSLSTHGIYNCTDDAGLQTWSNLTKLEILDLSHNSLDGSIIYDLASISSLRTLNLRDNNINSSLPINGFETWSNLTKLEMLDLSANGLPRSTVSSLTKVSSLRALYLDYNLMKGNVPVKELSALKLEVVSLRATMFSGSLPYLGHWSSLRALVLSENYDLSGTLTSKDLIDGRGKICRWELKFSEMDPPFRKQTPTHPFFLSYEPQHSPRRNRSSPALPSAPTPATPADQP